MKNLTNKQKNLLYFCLMLLFSMVIPVLVIMIRYKMIEAFFNASSKVKFSILGLILVCLVMLFNIKRIIKFLNDMPLSPVKCIINGVFKMIPLLCLVLILYNMNSIIDDLKFVFSWILGCNAISLFIFEPLWRHYNHEYHLDVDYKKWHEREVANDK